MRRAGATLLELLVALALSGLVLGVLVEASAALSRSIATTQTASAALAARGVGLQQLSVRLQAVSSRDTLPPPFGGTSDDAWFASRCRNADGGTSECVVELRLLSLRDSRLLEMRGGAEGFAAIGQFDQSAELRYYDSGLGEWKTEWIGASRAPRMLALVSPRDTLYFGTSR